jgi:hypothetical protein
MTNVSLKNLASGFSSVRVHCILRLLERLGGKQSEQAFYR